jgi:hypothetical protein
MRTIVNLATKCEFIRLTEGVLEVSQRRGIKVHRVVGQKRLNEFLESQVEEQRTTVCT